MVYMNFEMIDVSAICIFQHLKSLKKEMLEEMPFVTELFDESNVEVTLNHYANAKS